MFYFCQVLNHKLAQNRTNVHESQIYIFVISVYSFYISVYSFFCTRLDIS